MKRILTDEDKKIVLKKLFDFKEDLEKQKFIKGDAKMYDIEKDELFIETKDKLMKTLGGSFRVKDKAIYYFDQRNNGFMFIDVEHFSKWAKERIEQYALTKNNNLFEVKDDFNEEIKNGYNG